MSNFTVGRKLTSSAPCAHWSHTSQLSDPSAKIPAEGSADTSVLDQGAPRRLGYSINQVNTYPRADHRLRRVHQPAFPCVSFVSYHLRHEGRHSLCGPSYLPPLPGLLLLSPIPQSVARRSHRAHPACLLRHLCQPRSAAPILLSPWQLMVQVNTLLSTLLSAQRRIAVSLLSQFCLVSSRNRS